MPVRRTDDSGYSYLPTAAASDRFTGKLESTSEVTGTLHSVPLSRVFNRADLWDVSQRFPNGEVYWGMFEPVIRRWEQVRGEPAPIPTEYSEESGNVLRAEFGEWMMGLDVGHVTSPELGLSWEEQVTAIGNGVVPQQAALALKHLLSFLPEEVLGGVIES